jgi:hypothetical protein
MEHERFRLEIYANLWQNNLIHEAVIQTEDKMVRRLKAKNKCQIVIWKRYDDWKKELYDISGFWMLIHFIESKNVISKKITVGISVEFYRQIIIMNLHQTIKK